MKLQVTGHSPETPSIPSSYILSDQVLEQNSGKNSLPACNPGVCDCPDVACKLKKTKMQILATLLKYAIFGLAVEEAVRFGIWSDASKTDALTQRYLDWAEGFFSTKNKIQRSPHQVYEMARIRYNLKNLWNSIIIGLNDFIAAIPGVILNAPNMFTQKAPDSQLDLSGVCELNKGIMDEDD